MLLSAAGFCLAGLVARRPLLVACGARGGLRLTVSPLADGSPATRVPLSPLGDPHLPVTARQVLSTAPTNCDGAGQRFLSRVYHAPLPARAASPLRARAPTGTWHCRWMDETPDWA